ncbi:hypothetical protein SASPL_153725 [Salvia splendens]|uniref:Uncharacterized protein n=1 Tax=Salvia splendens TaxID=180675 RepID=A0A8X8VYU4_SALSN|nr:hypothetical protein SASPL_153725 [Salvia splendens]
MTIFFSPADIVLGDRHHVVVVGDVDSIELTWRLRKKVGCAQLMSVSDNAIANTKQAKPAVVAPVMSPKPSKKII